MINYQTFTSNIKSSNQSTIYIIGDNLLAYLDKLTPFNKNYSGYILLADETVYKLYSDAVLNSLQRLRRGIITIILPAGEINKSLSTVNRVLNKIVRSGINRNFCLINFGGGVVSDLGGFIASIFLRGIAYINIPTTLLSQVDASLGGKTGVDTWSNKKMHKNMIGTFYQPKAVISDARLLSTLPEKEINSGLGEMVKYWIGWGMPTINEMITVKNTLAVKTPRGWPKDSPEVEELITTIQTCQRIKISVVKKDPFELIGERQKLNLGHTIGHAVEGAANGRLSHGEAVSIGLVGAAKLSEKLRLLDVSVCEKIISQTKSLDLPIQAQGIDHNKIIDAMRFDKKSGNFILIKDIGKLVIGIKVNPDLVKIILSEIIV